MAGLQVAKKTSLGRAKSNAPENRRGEMLDVAARIFSKHGFDGTSIRDIAKEVGVQPSSLYYFFKSKEDLFEAVYEKGVDEIIFVVEKAITKSGAKSDNPWMKLEAASVGHLEALLSSDDYNTLVANIVPKGTGDFDERLIRHRDVYEKIFVDLVKDLPLPPRTNRTLLRLTILGALNGVVNWYRPGAASPTAIAKKIVQMFRLPLDPAKKAEV
ncbi:MAG: TetR/AcrR family transcriptional regulator [Alphaproteobacteria bacterium]|jgi:TetR/AcrR family transcriptional regulator, cholesterol catabolism regulator|nr:TetR/AcrR family transcriptional regulator [Alphaproteobacteria bacterium]MBT4016897.1 TetR/AcrR family transcriptional regulator [Alphaproteobacteria bacterium]MBT4965026.1 TetR/AcrR family transcriptional regulator [Alphaproteobacteria bacterium]MBT5161089.1 TetR/AcrR family transcriptional regulator [Alphaproteobacteria bacterium]MBT6387140.1 TetR/AcrR family transcriptional regulator [Alphaproteobacteria bacterium]